MTDAEVKEIHEMLRAVIEQVEDTIDMVEELGNG